MSMAAISKKKAIASILLGVMYTLLFSYDIEGSYETLSDRIVSGLLSYGFEKSVVSIGIAVLIYFILDRLKEPELKEHGGIAVISLFFGILNTSGIYIYYQGFLPRSVKGIFLFLVYVAAFSYAFYLAWKVFYFFAARLSAPREDDTGGGSSRLSLMWEKHTFVVCFCVILLCWAPWIISYYPASMEWDCYSPILQFLGEWTATNHHPWFYAIVVGGGV